MVLMLWPWFALMKSLGPSGVSRAVMVKRFLSFVSTTSFICDIVYWRNLGCDNYKLTINIKEIRAVELMRRGTTASSWT